MQEKPTKFPPIQNMNFNEKHIEDKIESTKGLLLVLMAAFALANVIKLVSGISIYFDYYKYSYFYVPEDRVGMLLPPMLCAVIAGLMLVMTAFGVCGSLMQNILVNVYTFILFLFLMVDLTETIRAFTLDTGRIMDNLEIPVSEYVEDRKIQNEIDNLQMNLNCCGSFFFLDYVGVEFNDNHSTVTWTYHDSVEDFITHLTVPSTCCFHASAGCEVISHRGCKEALATNIVEGATAIGVIWVSVILIQVLNVIIAVKFCYYVHKLKKERVVTQLKISKGQITQTPAPAQLANDYVNEKKGLYDFEEPDVRGLKRP